MSLEKLTIPDLGDSESVEVIEVLVSPGDEIQENDSLIVLETDKAAMEIPATSGGTVKEVLVKVGDSVKQGDEIVVLESAGDSADKKEPSAGKESSTDKEPSAGKKSSTDKEPSADKESSTDKEPSADAGKEPSETTEDKSENKKEESVDQDNTDTEEKKTAESSEGDSEEESTGEVKQENILVPDLGTDDAVEIIEILVSAGDEVNVDDGLLTLETDKAAMDVPSPFQGKIKDIKVKVGDKVKTGAVIMVAETVAAASTSATASKSQEKTKEAPQKTQTQSSSKQAESSASPQTASISPADQIDVYAGPAVRRLAREMGVDLREVQGTGTKDRIVKDDVYDYVKSVLQGGGSPSTASGAFALPTVKDIDFSQFGDIEEVELSKLHQVTARNMAQNWLTVPHVTQFEEADVTELENFRNAQKSLAEKKGIKLSPLPFIVKACALALAEFPQFNVSMHSSGTKLIQKKYIHIGVAVATQQGLMVPVLRDVDNKSVWEIAAEIAELSELAQDRKLTREHMSGGCFTVSSLGNLGGVGFTPIVNAPEVAILGVSKTQVKPVWQNEEFVPRQMLPFSLSYDHRAVNGVDGGLFCQYLNGLLSDIRLMVL